MDEQASRREQGCRGFSEVGSEVDLLIENGCVITMDPELHIYDPGFVATTDGSIVDVGPMSSCLYASEERLDATGMVVMPGIVNAHGHLDQSVYRNCFEEKEDSRDLMLQMARTLTPERARKAASLSLLEQLHHGITTTQENHWAIFHKHSTDGICEAIRESGMRGIVSRGMNDRPQYTPADLCEHPRDVLNDLDRLEAEYESDDLMITAEPTTILRTSPEAIRAMHDWALDRNKIWSIHLAQNATELQEALRTVHMGSVQYAKKLGVLGPEMLAIHCSGLLNEEVDLLGEYNVRIAHCPIKIMREGGLVPPIWALQERGARVALGTDGSATNNGQNPWEVMKLAVYMQRVRFGVGKIGSALQALEMATVKAAEALGLSERVGSLEPGKQADVVLFQRRQLHLVPDAKLISNMVYSGLNTRIDTVLVGGRALLQGGRSTQFDEEEIMNDVQVMQREMIREAGLQERVPSQLGAW